MSLATLAGTGRATLSDLVDAVAGRTGAWVVVERFGAVLTHGAGTGECPASLAKALLAKTTGPLRDAATWSRGGRHRCGTADGTDLVVADLGDGAAAWFVAGPVEEASLPLLSTAVHADTTPVTDPVVADLLHGRGPARRGRAPRALLLVLHSADDVAVLAQRAVCVVAGTDARVHTEADLVLVALPLGSDAGALVAGLARSCPTVVAGLAAVPDDASDWVASVDLARGSAGAAADLGLRVGDACDPAVAAELVVREAQGAVADLVRALPDAPLHRLREHDTRTSGDLVASLTAWCRSGFDVPAAAAALHVHTNTLRYRLKRAGEVSGLDLTRPRQLLALQLLLAV